MKINSQSSLRVVVYEGADSTRLADNERLELVSTLLTDGYDVTCVNGQGIVRENHGASMLVLGKFSGEMPSQVADAQGDGQVILNRNLLLPINRIHIEQAKAQTLHTIRTSIKVNHRKPRLPSTRRLLSKSFTRRFNFADDVLGR